MKVLLPIIMALMPLLFYAQNPGYFYLEKNDVSLLERLEETNDLENKAIVCPTDAKINEFHYNDFGPDANEFIEVIIPIGGDPTEIIIYLYNGFNGLVYDSYPLTTADLIGNDGTYDYYVWYPSLIQDGNDGIAIGCADGFPIQFITYMGSFFGIDGPFAQMEGDDIDVVESGTTPEGLSLQCDGSGFWYEECIASPGTVNDISTCTVIDCPGQGNIGTNCDDLDPTTENDTIGIGCICAGMPIVYDCPTLMLDFNTPCDDNDPTTENDFINFDCECVGSPIVYDCPAQMANIGDSCDDGIPISSNDVIIANCECVGTTVGACPVGAKINEFHYDDGGPDENEFIEIAVPIGGDGTEVVISLYNGFDGTVYDSYTLTSADFVSNDAIYEYYVWYPTLIQNGNDGIAISCEDGTTLQFLSYNGNIGIIATEGPYEDSIGLDIEVKENGFTLATESIQCSGSNKYKFDCIATPGITNDTTTCNTEDCPDLMAYFGDPCDDNNVLTGPDIITVDCTCEGPIIVYDCDNMINFGDPCDDGDFTTENDMIDSSCVCIGTPIIFDCPILMVQAGDFCDDGDPTTFVDVYQDDCSCAGIPDGTCPEGSIINEFHYDDGGPDANEFVEVAVPIGADGTEITITLYNGFDGSTYDSYTLTANDFVSSDGFYYYFVWYPNDIQNGTEGIAISCTDGTLLQFITYEGTFMATAGPYAGIFGVDTGVFENGFTTDTQSIQYVGDEWYFNCDATPGTTNNSITCQLDCPNLGNVGDPCDDFDGTTINDIVDVNCDCIGTPIGCTDPLACNYDANAVFEDGSCLELDCEGICGGTIVPGTLCDDGNPNTENDAFDANCECVGIEISCQLNIPMPYAGWHIISSYCHPDPDSITQVFAPIVADIIQVKNLTGQVYVPSFNNFNTFTTWDITQGYLVKVATSTTLPINGGIPVDLNVDNIPLYTGWNMIAYWLQGDSDPIDVFSNIATDVIQVKNLTGAYVPSFNDFNNMGNMEMTRGYQVKMNVANTLTYDAADILPRPATGTMNDNNAIEKLKPHHFTREIIPNPNSSTLLILDDENNPLQYGDELGVFTEDGVLVGSFVYENDMMGGLVFGIDDTDETIKGMNEGEQYLFKIWNKKSNSEKFVEVDFLQGNDRYLKDDLCVISFKAITTGINDSNSFTNISASPNPANDLINFNILLDVTAAVKLEIFSIDGKLIDTIDAKVLENEISSISYNVAQFNSGLYFYKISTGTQSYMQRFTVL